MCFPNLYVWFVFLSSLDILFTSIVLTLGGIEANPLVDWVLVRWGLVGIVAYKFTIVMFVVSMCEIVGRRRARAGRRLAEWTVAIAAIPVYLAVLQLLLSVRTYAG